MGWSGGGGTAPPECHTYAYLGYRFGIGLFGIQVWDWVIWDIAFGIWVIWDIGFGIWVLLIRSFINT